MRKVIQILFLASIGYVSYVGAGWLYHAVDAGELLRLGAPVWRLIAFGTVWMIVGLWWWRPIDQRSAFIAASAEVSLPPAAR
jgi:hypothetical protein